MRALVLAPETKAARHEARHGKWSGPDTHLCGLDVKGWGGKRPAAAQIAILPALAALIISGQFGKGKMRLSREQDIRIAYLIAAIWSVLTLMTYWNHSPPDMAALYFAGYLFKSGQSDLVYAAASNYFVAGEIVPAWQDAARAIGYAGGSAYPFFYPPVWAALMAPVTEIFSPAAFFRLSYLVQIPMIPASFFLAWRLGTKPGYLTIYLAVGLALLHFSVLGSHLLPNNQPAIAVAFGVLLWIWLYREDRKTAAAVVCFLIAAVKLYPGVLALLYIARKDWRSVAIVAALGATGLGLQAALVGLDLQIDFVARLREISERVFVTNLLFGVEGLLAQLTLTGESRFVLLDANWVNIAALAGFFLLLIPTLLNASRQGRSFVPVTSALVLMLLASAFGPLPWAYHYLPQMLMLPFLVAIVNGKKAWIIAAVVLLPWFDPGQQFWRGLSETFNYQQLLGTLSVAVLLALLVTRMILEARHYQNQETDLPV